jgi:glycosyltransferase involved in cell wall biosynthesis
MRILHIHKFFDQKGGAEQYLHQLMAKQVEAGHEVHVLSTRGPQNLPSPDERFFIHQFDFSRSEGPRRDAAKALAYVWNQEARRAVERVISLHRPDVVHLHNTYHHFSSSILGAIRKSNTPCVHTLHDLKLSCPNYKMFTEGALCERCKGGKYWNPILHHCVSSSFMANALAGAEMTLTKLMQSYERTVRVFICPSAFYAKQFVEWGEPAEKMIVIQNPVDLSPRVATGGGGYLLYNGRLSLEKGVETLIRASAQVPSLPLNIAGTGPEEERLRHIVRTLHANHIQFLGFVPPSQLEPLRMQAEAVVAPSVWYENSPLMVLEALAAGLPVLASRVGGLPELVEDGVNGLLAPPGNVEAWVELLKRFSEVSGSERCAMGERGRERARTGHAWSTHLHALEQAYEKARKYE